MSLRDRMWRTFTVSGRAVAAYERGDEEYVETLDTRHLLLDRRLDAIRSAGWVLKGRTLHKQVKHTKVTPRPDGTHTVRRKVTQDATYRFVRDVPSAQHQSEGVAGAGWYAESGVWRWWDGERWTAVHRQSGPTQPYGRREVHRPPPLHVLHLVLTVFTCGMWLPVWLWRVWRSR